MPLHTQSKYVDIVLCTYVLVSAQLCQRLYELLLYKYYRSSSSSQAKHFSGCNWIKLINVCSSCCLLKFVRSPAARFDRELNTCAPRFDIHPTSEFNLFAHPSRIWWKCPRKRKRGNHFEAHSKHSSMCEDDQTECEWQMEFHRCWLIAHQLNSTLCGWITI